MKKTLFSIAFLAASAGYVAYANHGFDGVLPTTSRPEEVAATPPAASIGKPSVSPAGLEQAPQASSVAPIVALATPAAPVPTPVAPVPTPVAPAAALPPLPRPRPADVPTVETAQAATSASAGQLRDGTYTGPDENAYYGRVQVQVTIANGQITSVKALDYPSDRRTSRNINSQALPLLQQEVMQAQSANVDTVSGATLTSDAYIQSLGNALRQAAGSNA